MQLPDYHIHTARCGHAAGRMEEYVERALKLGLPEIGFADHVPMYWLDQRDRDPTLAMPPEQLPEYVAEVERLRAAYPGITIRLGLEADYIPGYEEKLQPLLEGYPFDYVIGSVHYIDGWGFDNPAYRDGYWEKDINRLYREYFKLVRLAARSGLFDVVAHPDLIKKFGYRPRDDLREVYEETARAFAVAGVCVEVNTAGLRAPVGEIYPAPGFLRACCRHGVPATTGSDAHAPSQVGADFDSARRLLVEAGYEEIAFFKGRKKFFRKI